jgi:hypothetical protein
VKGYYRRATANMALNHFKDSLRDLKEVCGWQPHGGAGRGEG